MKQALELFNEKSYLKAEKIFLGLEQEAPLESLKYLFLISKSLGRSDTTKRFNAYFAALASSENHDDENQGDSLLELWDKNHLQLEIRNIYVLLEHLWKAGRVEDYTYEAKRVWTSVIESKLYAHPRNLFAILKKNNPLMLFNYFSYLVYLVEVGDTGELEKVCEEALELIQNKWEKVKSPGVSRLDSLEKLLEILSCAPENTSKAQAFILKIKRLARLESAKPMTHRELIEYIILFKDSPKELVSLMQGMVLRDKESLKAILREDPVYWEAISLLGPKYKKLIDAEQTYLKKEPVEQSLREELVDTHSIKSYLLEDQVEKFQKLKTSESELEVLARIKAGDRDLLAPEKSEALVHSLVGVGFFSAALAIIEQADLNEKGFYIKCHALMELGRHHELSEFARDLLGRNLKDPAERVPFLHMLALSQLQLGKKKDAQKVLTELLGIDPGYRNAQELMAIAKA